MDNLTTEYVCSIHLRLNQMQIWKNQSSKIVHWLFANLGTESLLHSVQVAASLVECLLLPPAYCWHWCMAALPDATRQGMAAHVKARKEIKENRHSLSVQQKPPMDPHPRMLARS
jgi:hypothetical protein